MRSVGVPHRLFALGASIVVAATLALSLAARRGAAPAGFELRRGDHVCLIGGTLAERMQHDGWLETRVQARFPEHQLVFRNLGFGGDALTVRQRTQGFGTPDEWLTRCEADVVFAFFGFNESFDGEAGLERFRVDLSEFITHTLEQRYDGESAPRLVLFSPIAHQDVGSQSLRQSQANNERLSRYTDAMADVARSRGVPFVDLFAASQRLYERRPQDRSAAPLTINGIFLSSDGNRAIAEGIERALFGDVAAIDAARLENIREAVVDKNRHWFQRYRTTDGFNVYGGRSNKRYAENVSNYEVLQREMQVLDVMTANRDQRVWARARGRDLEIDDGNTPPFIAVKTNKPGPGPDGSYEFLDGEKAIDQMTLADGFAIGLFASEKEFPDLINPVQMAFDTRGRLWVATWPTYTHWRPKQPMNDGLLIFEDTDGDGRADTRKVFAGDLHNPTGFEFWGGGVLVAQAPDLMFLEDRDGDDRADVRTRILHGISSADTHHTANSFVLGPDGALYFQEGTFHMSQIESPFGPVRNRNGCVWRFEPRTWRVDRFVPINFANPHGHVFDRWGQDIVHDGTGAVPYHALLASGRLDGAQNKHPGPPTVYDRRTRPCPGTEVLSSRHFPDANQQSLLVGNVIGFLGILQYRIDADGASLKGTEIEPVVQSTDPNFRPSDLEVGPDGAIYFTDWHNPLIGHLQHHIRDPSRDKRHGRIYRITHASRPLSNPPAIDGQPIDALLSLLVHPEDRVRYRTRIELSERDTDDVIAAVRGWVAGLDADDPEYEHHLLEGLWVFQQHDVVDEALLARVLRSPDHRARAAATRVLRYWNERIPDALRLVAAQARDAHALVRCEAVVAASFFRGADAAAAALEALRHPTDRYLEFALRETMRQLEPYWRRGLAAGEPFAADNQAGLAYLLDSVGTDELRAMPRSPAVCAALLERDGVPRRDREAALRDLAAARGTAPLTEALAAIGDQDQRGGNGLEDLAKVLAAWPAAELRPRADEILDIARTAQSPLARKGAYAALVAADGSTERVLALASASLGDLSAFLGSLEWIEDRAVLDAVYPTVKDLTRALPAGLAPAGRAQPATLGRFVRVELPRRGTLTLAEVEVFSGAANIARGKPARQSSTAYGGAPGRAVDGDPNGAYGAGTSTHTSERTPRPWWEVDLGAAVPIEKIVVWNRTDGRLGGRLDGFAIRVLDDARNEVWSQAENPAPEPSATFDTGGDPAAAVHAAAIDALVHIEGRDAETFDHLVELCGSDGARGRAAILALSAMDLPRTGTPAQRTSLARSVVARASSVPDAERHLPEFARAVALAEKLLPALPPAAKAPLRTQVAALRASIPKPIDPSVMELGREVYGRDAHCVTCHQHDGKGLANQYPPLIDSPWVTGSEERLIKMVLNGIWGKMVVDGVEYASPPIPPMIPFKDMLNDEEIAAVLTYVRNSWGNRAPAVTPETVARVRQSVADRTLFWTPEELLKEHPFK